jgi:hypothetical protein
LRERVEPLKREEEIDSRIAGISQAQEEDKEKRRKQVLRDTEENGERTRGREMKTDHMQLPPWSSCRSEQLATPSTKNPRLAQHQEEFESYWMSRETGPRKVPSLFPQAGSQFKG